MRVILALVVSAVLVKEQVTAQQTPTDSSVKQQVAALPSSSLVEVRIQGGNRLRGHIVNRGDADFTLEREKRAGTQTIAYDRVLSISQVNDRHSHKKWIIIGVVVAAVVVAVVVVVAIVKTQGPFAL